MPRTKRPIPMVDPNYVLHDNIDVTGTINYTNRYRFYNAIEELIARKGRLATQMRQAGMPQGPIIRINLGTNDEKEYNKQSDRFFNLLAHAKNYGIIIETNVVAPICLNSWAGKIIRQMATPGFRNMFEEAYHYYYPQTYDLKLKRKVLSTGKIIIPPEQLLEMGLCDTIFLNNGLIKTR